MFTVDVKQQYNNNIYANSFDFFSYVSELHLHIKGSVGNYLPVGYIHVQRSLKNVHTQV